MALGIGFRCIKYLLFVFNFVFVLAGIALIVAGSIALNVGVQLGDLVASPKAAATFIVVLGVIIFVIAFFGCCGAVRENYTLIIAFVVSLTIVFVLQLAVGIFGLAERRKIEHRLPGILNNSLHGYPNNDAYQRSWDFVQITLQCCGLNSPNDWLGVLNDSYSVPSSCCLSQLRNDSACGSNALLEDPSLWSSFLNTAGCRETVASRLSYSLVVIAVVALVLCVIQLLGITCASCLAHEIHHQYQTV